MTTKRLKRRAYLRAEIAKQRKWIDEHGSNAAGYVARYATSAEPDRGEAIYAADVGALRELERELGRM
jgi:hypothetical protein